MEPARFQRLDELLQAALALDPARREAFVDRACAGDAALRADLVRLLTAAPDTARFVAEANAAAADLASGPGAQPELPSIPGYRVLRRIGAGGMGVVYEAHDDELARNLAIKVIQDRRPAAGAPRTDDAMLARFLGEAQVTGQLDHPGVVPVHELGRDPRARVYFTMRLVTGMTAQDAFALARARRDGWSLTRALEVVLKICDTVAYAHAKGIIHRDLKPDNVMVGRFGEVYVMDWGLAKVVGQEDARDLRLRATGGTAHGVDGDADSLVTVDGAVLGTPSYMPPEQAHGRVDALDARSDVYAVGACLYTLLTGRQPYVDPGARASTHAILDAVRSRPPRPVSDIDRSTPAELAAICDKAMAREPAARYATMQEMADDLRAFLGDRVVKAYRTGAWVELSKWVRRNRGLAAGLAATFVTAVLGAIGIGFYAVRADEKTREAMQSLERFLQLADVVTLRNLVAEADALWPELPEHADAMADWLRRARDLARHRPGLEAALREVTALGHPLTSAELEAARAAHPRAAELAQKRDRLAAAEKELASRNGRSPEDPARTDPDRPVALEPEIESLHGEAAAVAREIEASLSPRFDKSSDQFLHATLDRLVRDLGALEAPDGGVIAAVETSRLWASTVHERTVVQESEAWNQAIASIANAAECPAYRGLRLSPQVGLIPLARDPASGLWEFWHPRTGARPERNANGRHVVTEETGIVFVLIPGGSFWMGTQRSDKDGRNYDPQATPVQDPVHEVALAPFLLAKYETTQGQWERVRHVNPASIRPGMALHGNDLTLSQPVESVSWLDCAETARRLGFVLPTEAQWEYACRAGTGTRWHTGDTLDTLRGFANIADEGSKSSLMPGWPHERGFADGYPLHAPVGTFRPNAFGLHDMHGNVSEWCGDEFGSYRSPPRPGDGARAGNGSGYRVYRGGSFNSLAFVARSAVRGRDKPAHLSHIIGCRLAVRIVE